MHKKPKFKPVITRVKLNPEQAVLSCTCISTGVRSRAIPDHSSNPDGNWLWMCWQSARSEQSVQMAGSNIVYREGSFIQAQDASIASS